MKIFRHIRQRQTKFPKTNKLWETIFRWRKWPPPPPHRPGKKHHPGFDLYCKYTCATWHQKLPATCTISLIALISLIYLISLISLTSLISFISLSRTEEERAIQAACDKKRKKRVSFCKELEKVALCILTLYLALYILLIISCSWPPLEKVALDAIETRWRRTDRQTDKEDYKCILW